MNILFRRNRSEKKCMCFVTDLQSKIIILPGILIFGLFQLEYLSQKDIKFSDFQLYFCDSQSLPPFWFPDPHVQYYLPFMNDIFTIISSSVKLELFRLIFSAMCWGLVLFGTTLKPFCRAHSSKTWAFDKFLAWLIFVTTGSFNSSLVSPLEGVVVPNEL